MPDEYMYTYVYVYMYTIVYISDIYPIYIHVLHSPAFVSSAAGSAEHCVEPAAQETNAGECMYL